MIIPSIDIRHGSAVQLIGGKEQVIDAGNPVPIAEEFNLIGEVAIIDLDAAMGSGSNEELISNILQKCSARVGGGIRSLEKATTWLDRGASKIILGTAASKELLRELPRERTIVALDCLNGEIQTHGWTRRSGQNIFDRIVELREYTGGFLVTFIEREGRMQGIDLETAVALKALAGDVSLTVAGGISSAKEIAELDKVGIDAQVGMALYTGSFDLADALAEMLRSDRPDGLWPTVVVNEHGSALGLTYSNKESLRAAIKNKSGFYQSRTRGLWKKGESSGNGQELLHVDLDCDRDTLRFVVRQHGDGFCHNNWQTCWGDLKGIQALEARLQKRMSTPIPGSYTNRLLTSPELLSAKLHEEAIEFIEAKTKREHSDEAADVLYFLLVELLRNGISFREIESELDRRSLTVTRRPGNIKEYSH